MAAKKKSGVAAEKQKWVFGFEAGQFWKDYRFYSVIQVLIWIKVTLFFFFFGRGISFAGQPILINAIVTVIPQFGNMLHVGDFIFHQLMHLLIAGWVFLLAKHVKRVNPLELSALFLVADVMHNVGYWLTFSHPSSLYSVMDFISDFFTLWVFFGLFYGLLSRWPWLRSIRIPFFDTSPPLRARAK
jgi:hypothetical protein